MKNDSLGIIFGMHAVKAMLATKPHEVSAIYLARKKIDPGLGQILQAAQKAGITMQTISSNDLDLMLPESNHQGIAAKLRDAFVSNYSEGDLEFFLDNLREPPFLLILDGVQDPHNLGACLRTANAAGVHAVIAPKDRAVGLTSVVRKVACGAAEVTPFIAVTNLRRTIDMLKQRGIWFYGALAEAENSIYQTEIKGAVAIVLGGEGQGLRRLTREACDYLVSIPMRGKIVTSLNVSVAAGVCLFEVVRQSKVL